MGLYIQTPHNLDKATQLMGIAGTERIPEPTSFDPPEGKVYICVVQNGPWDAAGICYDEQEFQAFTDPKDPRRKDWLLMERDMVVRLNPLAALELP